MKVAEFIAALKGCEDFDIEFTFSKESGQWPDIHMVKNLEICDIAYADKKVVLDSNDDPEPNAMAIPLSDGKFLVAEAGCDTEYPNELYVYQRNADGTESDIAYIGQRYKTDENGVITYLANKYQVLTINQYGDLDTPQEHVDLNMEESNETTNI